MNQKFHLWVFLTFCISCIASQFVYAAISVSPLRLEFGDGNNMSKPQNILIKNIGTKVAFVKLKILSIQNLNTKDRQEVPLENKSSNGVFFLPDKLILKPQQSKLVRVMMTEPATDKDKIFLIESTEVESLDSKVKTKAQIIYATSVIVHARNATPNISASRTDHNVILSNSGNTSAKITSHMQCDDKDENCQDPRIVMQLLAGQTVTVTVPYARPLTYDVRYLDQKLTQSSN